ncbi:MAG: FAD-dependent oxidoreductase [Burkholderiales bacterium]|nr:FAD-dependent oxidoreductase [Burkholderiales bacterium]
MTSADLRIAGVARGALVRFTFDGREIEAHEGESVAAALWAAGVRAWSGERKPGQPPSRALFCAMGVCQQCALWIDGRRVESCRAAVRAGMEVRTAPPAATAATSPAAPRADEFDVVVLGAGPAGATAALEAQAQGLRAVLVDEAAAAGGQVFRVAPGIAGDGGEGDALRAAVGAAGIERCFDTRVWSVERVDERWLVHALDPHGARCLRARALIVASGATERHHPFAGWDRPGVIGLAAATILLKAQRMLPGREVVVAGSGPLLLLVAKSIVEAGGRVVAVVDSQPRAAWLAQVPALASRPDLVARGLAWRRTMMRAGVPYHFSRTLTRVAGEPPSLAVEVSGGLILRADAVCCGYGLMPATDATRLIGASHAYTPERGGWHVVVDDDQRCDRDHVFAAGDCTGIAGAAAAPLSGRIAALSAARDLGRLDDAAFRRAAAPLKRQRDRAARFGLGVTRVAVAPAAAIAADTLVCQCEGLTRATLAAAIDGGCATLNELKTATRCGMGPCGGRLCEDAAARLVAARLGVARDAVGQATGRPPLRPVDLDALAGAFDYEALPIAAPSPL